MAGKAKTGIISEWVHRHSDLYQSAIRSPFVLSIRDGSLDLQSYSRWLEQDYVFVKAFVRYICSIVVKAPGSASDEEIDTLLGGVNALQQELAWFRSQASKWNLRFDKVPVHEITKNYCQFLQQLSGPDVEYEAALATLWIIEAVYNESFAICAEAGAKTAPELQEACQRWGSEEFRSYCEDLMGLADRALNKAAPAVVDKAESLFKQVLRLEVEFWRMSSDDKSHT